MHLEYPGVLNTRYRDRHPRYILETAKAAGVKVTLIGDTLINGGFTAKIDGVPVVFDFNNYPDLTAEELTYPHVFKFHTETGMPANVHPFPVLSFYDWNQYERLACEVSYQASGDVVSSRQRPYGGAVERRQRVQKMLRTALPEVWTGLRDQLAYWQEVACVLAAVFVPGARNDMLDRAHTQYLGLGCCTISPPIKTLLPGPVELVPGEHYVCCKPDYSDLIDRVQWCSGNRDECRRIGSKAKALWRATCRPTAIWERIREIVHG